MTDRDEIIRRMFEDGARRSEIAAALGTTRNVVTGIIFRRGWNQPPGAPSTTRRKVGYTNGLALVRRKQRRAEEAVRNSEPAPVVLPPTGTPFYLLRDHQCRFIPGEPAWDAPTCGARRAGPGVAYCAEHLMLVYGR